MNAKTARVEDLESRIFLISFQTQSRFLNAKRKVKWILSSRPEVDIYNKLKNRHASDTILELDVHARKEPVQAYMKYKLSEMKRDS